MSSYWRTKRVGSESSADDILRRRARVLGGLLLGLLAACIGTSPARAQTAPAAPAQDPPAQTPTPAPSVVAFFKQTEVSGFVDVYFGYNFNTPSTRQAQVRNFDTQHNSFSLNLAEFSLAKKPAADSRAGFRVDLDYGPTASLVSAAEPGGAQTFQNVLQAYASYLAPLGHGLQLDVGKFMTPIGNEVIKTRDNWNYSRSLLFTLAEPYYHAGVRASYPINDHFSLSGLLVNGWNNVVDNNTGKTVGVQATLKPTASFTIIQSYMGGPEQADDNTDWRHLSDTVVTYTVTPTVSLAMNYDYGRDTVGGSSVTWQGVAAYLRYQPKPWFAIAPRAEYYDDPDGTTTGVAQKIKEATLTMEFTPKGGLLLRAEYRRDMSDNLFFLKDESSLVKSQDTLTVGIVYAFSSR
jgi:hypothetical protein